MNAECSETFYFGAYTSSEPLASCMSSPSAQGPASQVLDLGDAPPRIYPNPTHSIHPRAAAANAPMTFMLGTLGTARSHPAHNIHDNFQGLAVTTGIPQETNAGRLHHYALPYASSPQGIPLPRPAFTGATAVPLLTVPVAAQRTSESSAASASGSDSPFAFQGINPSTLVPPGDEHTDALLESLMNLPRRPAVQVARGSVPSQPSSGPNSGGTGTGAPPARLTTVASAPAGVLAVILAQAAQNGMQLGPGTLDGANRGQASTASIYEDNNQTSNPAAATFNPGAADTTAPSYGAMVYGQHAAAGAATTAAAKPDVFPQQVGTAMNAMVKMPFAHGGVMLLQPPIEPQGGMLPPELVLGAAQQQQQEQQEDEQQLQQQQQQSVQYGRGSRQQQQRQFGVFDVHMEDVLPRIAPIAMGGQQQGGSTARADDGAYPHRGAGEGNNYAAIAAAAAAAAAANTSGRARRRAVVVHPYAGHGHGHGQPAGAVEVSSGVHFADKETCNSSIGADVGAAAALEVAPAAAVIKVDPSTSLGPRLSSGNVLSLAADRGEPAPAPLVRSGSVGLEDEEIPADNDGDDADGAEEGETTDGADASGRTSRKRPASQRRRGSAAAKKELCRERNRTAQRRFRERQKDLIRALQEQVEKQEALIAELQSRLAVYECKAPTGLTHASAQVQAAAEAAARRISGAGAPVPEQ